MQNIFIFLGNKESDIQEVINKQKNNFLSKYDASNIIIFDFSEKIEGESIEKKIKNAYENLSLFATKKLVIIKNISQILKSTKTNDDSNLIKDDARVHHEQEGEQNNINNIPELILNYLEKSKDNIITIIQDRVIDRRSKFFKGLQNLEKIEKAKIQNLSFDEKNNIENWIMKIIKENNFNITQKALNKLLEKFNIKKNYKGEYDTEYDTIKIKNQLSKIFNFSKEGLIKEEDLNQLDLNYENPNDDDIFELTNLIFEKNKKALELFEKNFYNDINEKLKLDELIFLNTILINQVEELIVVSELIEKRKTDKEIAEVLNWKNPKKIYPVKMKLKHFNRTELLNIYKKLEEIDVLSKTDQSIALYKLNLLVIDLIK